MNDGKFYAVLLVGFGVVVIIALCFLNWLQPEGVNVELIKQIGLFATPIVTGLFVLLNGNANRAVVEKKVENKVDQVAEKTSKAVEDKLEATLNPPPRP